MNTTWSARSLAHALMHQASRERDAEGHVIATIADYAAVRELVANLVSEGVEATVAPEIRETVAAVHRLYEENSGAVSLCTVAEALGIYRSSVSRRIKTAIDKGYLENLEDRKGKPGRYQPADPLPDDIEVLPRPEEVHRCALAPNLEGIHTPPPSSSGGGSACGEARGARYPSDDGATPQHSDGKVE